MKNELEIPLWFKDNIEFNSPYINGGINKCILLSFNAITNTACVKVIFGTTSFEEDGWNLQHLLWAFEKNEFTLIESNDLTQHPQYIEYEKGLKQAMESMDITDSGNMLAPTTERDRNYMTIMDHINGKRTLRDEYDLVQLKKSTLSSSCRKLLISLIENHGNT